MRERERANAAEKKEREKKYARPVETLNKPFFGGIECVLCFLLFFFSFFGLIFFSFIIDKIIVF